MARPRLPGYVAISGTTLTGVYSPPAWRLFFAPFADLEPVAVVGHSIHVFWVEEWPSPPSGDSSVDPMAHRALADALLHGLAWPDRASWHYAQYLASRPADAATLTNYGASLAASGRTADGIAALQQAVSIEPRHAMAQGTLARALFISQDIAGATVAARHAVALRPDDADSRVLMGRIQAVQGLFVEAERHFADAVRLDPDHRVARDLLDRVQRTRQASSGAERPAP